MTSVSLKRAVALMTVTSALTPVIGVVTAPLLTHGLGVDGRGSLSVASAPNVLLAGVVTFGLPEALTFFTARSPSITGRALRWAVLLTMVLCFVGVLVIVLFTPFLVGSEPQLAPLILVGSVLAAPLLVISLLRGAAAGLQMWNAIALERVAGSLVRLALVAGLFLSGHLTVLTALLATSAGPIIGVLAYVRLGAVAKGLPDAQVDRETRLTDFFRYGAQTWFGAVAGILLSRINQLLFAPLSSVDQLGLYVVAVTISDVPLITALAIRDALFGVNSRQNDAVRLAATARTTTFIGLIGGAAIAATMPLWIAPVFGPGFGAAMPATAVLILSAVLNIPAYLAAAGIAAWGRPALRSVGLVMTLLVNIVLFLVLVPPYGAVGAAAAAAISAAVSAIFMSWFAHRLLHVPLRDLLLVRWSDLKMLASVLTQMAGRPLRRLRRA